jgi:hypothetical protein
MASPLFPHRDASDSHDPLTYQQKRQHPPQQEINYKAVPHRIVSAIYAMCYRLMRPSLCVERLYSLPAAISKLSSIPLLPFHGVLVNTSG